MLSVVHRWPGVSNDHMLPVSSLAGLWAFVGTLAGFGLQDRRDLGQFRRWTLVFPVPTGGNLTRRTLQPGF